MKNTGKLFLHHVKATTLTFTFITRMYLLIDLLIVYLVTDQVTKQTEYICENTMCTLGTERVSNCFQLKNEIVH